MDLYPPDFSTELGRLRALIPDVDQSDFADSGEASYLFSDQHLNAFLALYSSSTSQVGKVKRAAASALTAIATSEALISKVIRTEDLQTDGAKLATALLSAAGRLNREAEDDDEREDDLDGGGFAIVDFEPMPRDYFNSTWRGFPGGCGCGGGCGGGCGNYGHGSGFGRWQ
jgi:hypothetical protein